MFAEFVTGDEYICIFGVCQFSLFHGVYCKSCFDMLAESNWYYFFVGIPHVFFVKRNSSCTVNKKGLLDFLLLPRKLA